MATLKNTTINDTGYLLLPSGNTAQRPSSPSAGMTRWNTSLSQAELWNGTVWLSLSTILPSTVDYLIVAGGAGAGAPQYHSGGGGAGGLLNLTTNVSAGFTYTITVGAGGAAGPNGSKGSDGGFSAISGDSITELPSGQAGANTIKCFGGGGGGVYPTVNAPGRNGGSGGGAGAEAGATNIPGGKGIYLGSTYISSTRQGYDGGTFIKGTGAKRGGGGGGAGVAGGNADENTGGNGGNGLANPFQGSGSTSGQLVSGTYYFSGGGGGSTEDQSSTTTGGYGGGGGGSSFSGGNGVVNTGGGGGAGERFGTASSGSGGSGIVIIQYPNTFSQATTTTGSPAFLDSGGYYTYTWTSSGSITF